MMKVSDERMIELRQYWWGDSSLDIIPNTVGEYIDGLKERLVADKAAIQELRTRLAFVKSERDEYKLLFEELLPADSDDIRGKGWTIAVHNDYRQGGLPFTFWLFTKDGRAVKGEGETDALALAAVRLQIAEQGSEATP